MHERGRWAIEFSLNPEHRFSHPDCPFPVLYLAEAPATCLWERFGDDVLNPGSMVARSLWQSRMLSRVEVPELRLCDLTDAATVFRARVDLSALTSANLTIPQEWGLRLQEHSSRFDGLRYLSRFDARPCLALFARPGLVPRLRAEPISDLVDSPAGDHFLRQHHVSLV